MVVNNSLFRGRRAGCVLENHNAGIGKLLFTNFCSTRTERNLKIDGAPGGGEFLTLAATGVSGECK